MPSENELGTLFGVSRVSIRQALQKLITLGIIETRQGEGSFVRSITSDNYSDMLLPAFLINNNTLRDILEYRSIMEVGVIELACDRITEKEISNLEEIVTRMESNNGNLKEFASDDLAFHDAIIRASKNDLIINVCEFVYEVMATSMEQIVSKLGMADGKYYHRLILEKLRNNEKDAAIQAMKMHVERTVLRIGEEN